MKPVQFTSAYPHCPKEGAVGIFNADLVVSMTPYNCKQPVDTVYPEGRTCVNLVGEVQFVVKETIEQLLIQIPSDY